MNFLLDIVFRRERESENNIQQKFIFSMLSVVHETKQDPTKAHIFDAFLGSVGDTQQSIETMNLLLDVVLRRAPESENNIQQKFIFSMLCWVRSGTHSKVCVCVCVCVRVCLYVCVCSVRPTEARKASMRPLVRSGTHSSHTQELHVCCSPDCTGQSVEGMNLLLDLVSASFGLTC